MSELGLLQEAVRVQDQYIAEQVAALRELRAYCQGKADAKTYDHASAVRAKCYKDVTARLDAVLNNVTGVETEL